MTNKLPPGVVIATPMGRRARVMFYDSDERVHVEYMDGNIPNEQGCFPGKLVQWARPVKTNT